MELSLYLSSSDAVSGPSVTMAAWWIVTGQNPTSKIPATKSGDGGCVRSGEGVRSLEAYEGGCQGGREVNRPV